MIKSEYSDINENELDSLLIARNIATAVAELHTIGFVHSKLSAQSIMVNC